MKNLKKVLSLVLALAMALSLMTVAFAKDASDYSDYSKVTYKEAVDVMTATGVIDGMGGSFNPTGTLTREQAAKIITYMIMGKAAADKLTTTIAPYSDVSADRWSAGAIAYCTNAGILDGVGNGKFNPTGELTGLQFAKMLLVALGYDPKIESLTGTSWAINSATLAINIGLDDGMEEVSLSNVLTREQAALMAFNTMKATLVKYDNKGTEINLSDGTSVVVGATPAKEVTANGATVNYNGAASSDHDYGTLQFAEKYCEDLERTSAVDKYQSAADTWSYQGVKIGSYSGTATIVYTAEMKAEDIEGQLEGYTNYNAGTAVPSYWNGKSYPTYISNLTAAAIANCTGNGTVVEIYTSKNEVTKVVVKEALVGTVTAISDKNETITIVTEAANTGNFGTTSASLTTKEGYGKFKKDDVVLVYAYNTANYTATGATVTDVKALTAVEGIASAKNTAKDTITVDGTPYTAAEGIADAYDVANFGVSSKYNATLYLDQYGYIMYAKPGAAVNNDKAAVVLKTYQGLVDGAVTDMVQVITSDGEVHDWKCANIGSLTKGSFYTYTSDSDDVYTLTATFGAAYADGATLVKGGVTLDSSAKTLELVSGQKAYFASNVKFIFVDSDGKYVVKDGVQNIKTSTWVMGTIDVVDGVNYITALFVSGSASNTTVSDKDIVFIDASSKTTNGYSLTDKDGKVQTYDTYDAYIAGEKLDLFYTKDAVAADGFYTVEKDNDNGDYKLTSNAYSDGDKGELSVSTEETYAALVGNVLTGAKDYDISNAVFVDVTGNDYSSFAEVKADIDDAGNLAVTGAKFMVVYDYDTNVASYVYLTDILP